MECGAAAAAASHSCAQTNSKKLSLEQRRICICISGLGLGVELGLGLGQRLRREDSEESSAHAHETLSRRGRSYRCALHARAGYGLRMRAPPNPLGRTTSDGRRATSDASADSIWRPLVDSVQATKCAPLSLDLHQTTATNSAQTQAPTLCTDIITIIIIIIVITRRAATDCGGNYDRLLWAERRE